MIRYTLEALNGIEKSELKELAKHWSIKLKPIINART